MASPHPDAIWEPAKSCLVRINDAPITLSLRKLQAFSELCVRRQAQRLRFFPWCYIHQPPLRTFRWHRLFHSRKPCCSKHPAPTSQHSPRVPTGLLPSPGRAGVQGQAGEGSSGPIWFLMLQAASRSPPRPGIFPSALHGTPPGLALFRVRASHLGKF